MDGEVLFAQREDLSVEPGGLGGDRRRPGAPGRVAVGQEEGPLRLSAELMAEDAEAAGGVSEAACGFGGGELSNCRK